MSISVNDVIMRVNEIRDLQHDEDLAHGEEDKLYYDVLLAIANGAENAAELAREAIKTQDIEFSRFTS